MAVRLPQRHRVRREDLREAVGADVPKGVLTLAYRTPPDHETTPFRIFPAHLVKVLPTVLLAGKGHEEGQTVGDSVRPFDDAAIARLAVAEPQM